MLLAASALVLAGCGGGGGGKLVGASFGGDFGKDRGMSLARRVRTWTGGIGLWRKVAIALAAAALASGIATYLALTGRRVGLGDARYCGYATHHVPRASLAALRESLFAAPPRDAAAADAAIMPFAAAAEPAFGEPAFGEPVFGEVAEWEPGPDGVL